ncbi:hypothetical protein ABEB36_011543 [Hypothenemus hampei]|uniref:Uncharacterized protein n=1 Tax=Hypothenemus hampei TaxID=57062 RepID=A0ABD1E8H1_HYPHA
MVDDQNLIQYCHALRTKTPCPKITLTDEDDEEIWLKNNSQIEDIYMIYSKNINLDERIQVSLYYLIGSLIHKLSNNIECSCIKQLTTDRNSQDIASIKFYQYVYNCELVFREKEHYLLNNIMTVNDFINKCLSNNLLFVKRQVSG